MSESKSSKPEQPTAAKAAETQPAVVEPTGDQKPAAADTPDAVAKPTGDEKADAKAEIPTDGETAEPEKTEIKTEAKKSRFAIELSMTTWILLVVMLVSLWLGQGLMFNTWRNETMQQQLLIKEKERQLASSQQLGNVLQQYDEQLQQIDKSFPDESGLSQFAQTMRRYLSGFPEGKLQFDTSDPLVLPNERIPTLPLTISMLTTYEAFIAMMDDMAHSPYLFVPTDVQIAYNQENPKLVRVILKGRLYVSPIFQ